MLPQPNLFVPDDFALLATSGEDETLDLRAVATGEKPAVAPPNLLSNSSEGMLWHRTDTSFGLPMALRRAEVAHFAMSASYESRLLRRPLARLSDSKQRRSSSGSSDAFE